MNRYIFFSICWGIFFAVLWKFARREGDNTSQHRMDGRHKSHEKMDYSSWLMISQRLFCWFSLNLRFSSSICVSENKDVQITQWKKCRVFFNHMTFVHLGFLALQFSEASPYLYRWEFTEEVRKCYTKYLPILPSNSQLYFHFSLCVNYTVKEQDIGRNGLWKPLNVYGFWSPLEKNQTASFNQGILQGWSYLALRYRNSGRHINYFNLCSSILSWNVWIIPSKSRRVFFTKPKVVIDSFT